MNISPAIQKTFGRGLLQAQKHSPLILTAMGVIGVVTAGVLAARATLSLEETVDDSNREIKWAKQSVENQDESPIVVTRAYIHSVGRIIKLYGPSVTLGAASLVCIVSAQGILHKRNLALAAAYKGLETAFSSYRERVVEAYGEDIDRDFRQGIHHEESTDDKGKKVKTLVVDAEKVGGSDYLFDFGPENQNWTGFHEHNLYFLTAQQNMQNDLLRARGHVFLNEVLDGLGIQRTTAGAVVGWVWKPNEEHSGDNFIDFGIRDLQDSHGYVLLDFNVDGTIFDKI